MANKTVVKEVTPRNVRRAQKHGGSTFRGQVENIIAPQTESIAIKGCSYIYAPAGQAGEYAPLAANPYKGCGHGCSYCYVPLILHMPRTEFDLGAKARPEYLVKLEKDAKKYQKAGITEQVISST